jgi:monoterpene epsilon-lactone hydrolase
MTRGYPNGFTLGQVRCTRTIQAIFPQTVITTGARDLILSNGVRLYWTLRDAGVTSELLVMEGGWHGFNWEPDLEERRRARTAVPDFMLRRLYDGEN